MTCVKVSLTRVKLVLTIVGLQVKSVLTPEVNTLTQVKVVFVRKKKVSLSPLNEEVFL